ncbi:hypothetical protein HDU80_000836 [Chytriomyces hyalinus]|nr:hypothetical protein HDU80_000836 [Chytriomyces hyalinus]
MKRGLDQVFSRLTLDSHTEHTDAGRGNDELDDGADMELRLSTLSLTAAEHSDERRGLHPRKRISHSQALVHSLGTSQSFVSLDPPAAIDEVETGEIPLLNGFAVDDDDLSLTSVVSASLKANSAFVRPSSLSSTSFSLSARNLSNLDLEYDDDSYHADNDEDDDLWSVYSMSAGFGSLGSMSNTPSASFPSGETRLFSSSARSASCLKSDRISSASAKQNNSNAVSRIPRSRRLLLRRSGSNTLPASSATGFLSMNAATSKSRVVPSASASKGVHGKSHHFLSRNSGYREIIPDTRRAERLSHHNNNNTSSSSRRNDSRDRSSNNSSTGSSRAAVNSTTKTRLKKPVQKYDIPNLTKASTAYSTNEAKTDDSQEIHDALKKIAFHFGSSSAIQSDDRPSLLTSFSMNPSASTRSIQSGIIPHPISILSSSILDTLPNSHHRLNPDHGQIIIYKPPNPIMPSSSKSQSSFSSTATITTTPFTNAPKSALSRHNPPLNVFTFSFPHGATPRPSPVTYTASASVLNPIQFGTATETAELEIGTALSEYGIQIPGSRTGGNDHNAVGGSALSLLLKGKPPSQMDLD